MLCCLRSKEIKIVYKKVNKVVSLTRACDSKFGEFLKKQRLVKCIYFIKKQL